MRNIKILREIAPRIKIIEKEKKETPKNLEQAIKPSINTNRELNATHSHVSVLEQSTTTDNSTAQSNNINIRQNEFSETRRTDQQIRRTPEQARVYGADTQTTENRNYDSVILRESRPATGEIVRPASNKLQRFDNNQLRNQTNQLQNPQGEIEDKKYTLDDEEFRRRRRKTDQY